MGGGGRSVSDTQWREERATVIRIPFGGLENER